MILLNGGYLYYVDTYTISRIKSLIYYYVIQASIQNLMFVLLQGFQSSLQNGIYENGKKCTSQFELFFETFFCMLILFSHGVVVQRLGSISSTFYE